MYGGADLHPTKKKRPDHGDAVFHQGDDWKEDLDDERKQRDKRHEYREHEHGPTLDKKTRDQVVDLAALIGREYGRHLAGKLAGRRTWRKLITTNDRRLLLRQLELIKYGKQTEPTN